MKLICIGDSNTYGYDPTSYFGDVYKVNWTNILEELKLEVINDGFNGRCIPTRKESYPEDALLIVMLGSNDLLMGRSVHSCVESMKYFLNYYDQPRLLIGPPVFCRGAWIENDEIINQSKMLNKAYETLAKELNIYYYNAGELALCYDGVHLTEASHIQLGRRLVNCLEGLNVL
ncbi:MAG: lipase [Erysipelotrichaceae bacterium]|nr:lipase [Erysipelotrichaceae bacterium]